MSVQQLEAIFGAAIKFAPDLSNDVTSLYAVMATGNRHLFDVVVNNLTQDIKVVFADTTEVDLDRKVKMVTTLTPDGVVSRPSGTSVKSIVYPKIISLLADKLAA